MFAIRYNADDELIAMMESELHDLQAKYPNGFLVRLHVLGDFYSVSYVAQWAKRLRHCVMLAAYALQYVQAAHIAINSRHYQRMKSKRGIC